MPCKPNPSISRQTQLESQNSQLLLRLHRRTEHPSGCMATSLLSRRNFRTAYTVLALLVSVCSITALPDHTTRRLRQAKGPGFYGKPLSATPADLFRDPSGRAHLLAKLGQPLAYHAYYADALPEGEYAIDPTVDPVVVNPIPGNGSPTNGTYAVVGNSGMIAIHSILFANGEILFFGRPTEPYGDPAGPKIEYLTTGDGAYTEIASIYDTAANTYVPFHMPDAAFCGAQTILPDGRAIIVGGDHTGLWYPYLQFGSVAVRIYDPTTHSIETVINMDKGRWYPSVMTMTDGNILIVGGGQQDMGGWGPGCTPNGAGSSDPYWDNPSYTIYNVSANTLSPSLALTILMEAHPINLYPYLFLMPTGSTLIVTGLQMGAMYLTAAGATQDEAIGELPELPYPIGPNQNTPVTMLPLQPPLYEVKILVAGGSSVYCPGGDSPALDQSYIINVTPGANHSVVAENLAYPRIMGDLTILPDGRIFLCNGAQFGTGGGRYPRYGNLFNATTLAEIYDHRKPVGQRWATVGDAQIPRLYHSVALLTANATVLISGSETSAERRVQIWTPDYLLTGKPRPVITSAPASAGYNSTMLLAFSGVAAIDYVTLIRPGSATHGVHFDERSVVLACAPSSNGSVACQAPPSPNIAPPGQYMCFILSEGVPSMAKYISLTAALATKAVPLLPSSLTGLTAGVAAPPESALAPLTGAPALALLTGAPAPGPSGLGDYARNNDNTSVMINSPGSVASQTSSMG